MSRRRTWTSTESSLEVAIVGCGGIAHEHLIALSRIEAVSVSAVCDVSAATAEFVARRYGVTDWFGTIDEMLDRQRPRVVHVLTPPHTHGIIVRRALEAGCHVICEKPLAPDALETIELLELANEQGLELIESQNLLFNDSVLDIDRLVAAGRLGEVREVDVSLCLDLTAGPFGDQNLAGPGVRLRGGAVHDFLPHLAYLYLHFAKTGSDPVDGVCGTLTNRSGNRRVGFDSLDALVDSGRCRGRLHVASDVEPSCFRLRVSGMAGSVETDLYNPYLRLEGRPNAGQLAPLEQIRTGRDFIWAGFENLRNKVGRHGTMHGLQRMLMAFYSALDAGQPPPITSDDIVATARLVDQLVSLQRAL